MSHPLTVTAGQHGQRRQTVKIGAVRVSEMQGDCHLHPVRGQTVTVVRIPIAGTSVPLGTRICLRGQVAANLQTPPLADTVNTRACQETVFSSELDLVFVKVPPLECLEYR